MSKSAQERRVAALPIIQEQLSAAAAAPKCHVCGCLRKTVEAFEGTALGRAELTQALSAIRGLLRPTEYDCLGCSVCYPAIAANAFSEACPSEGEALDLCPTEAPAERRGWPPLPGHYHVLRYRAPVAICTLGSATLAERIAERAWEGVSVVGTLHTENLGIERIVRNVLANPNIRFLVLCGEDTRQAVGHLPGQSLVSLFENGLDEGARIVGARGKRPVLKNVRKEQVEVFRRKIELVRLIGVEDEAVILGQVSRCLESDPGPWEHSSADIQVPVIVATEPRRLVPDPSGFFVVYPDLLRRRLIVEHYTRQDVLDCVLEGVTPAALYSEAANRGLLSRLDHAAYLGRELARAERSIETGEPYVQDRAAGEIATGPIDASPACCYCGPACSTGESTWTESGPGLSP
ncbi:MAG: DUF4346 domain-containing protein [Acidobacteria bacterium]|nr:DUF4346 domain-containing protein [Acidobacteriota bacterium]MCK6683258.1 DUF4346 domain-containing protein [Thermoanaerobaculia bacterium]